YIILFHCITGARNCRSVQGSFSSKQGVIFRGDSRNKLVHRPIFFVHRLLFQWKELLFANSMHMNIHLGIKPFACEICGSKFSNRGARCNHMKKHSSVSPFVCPLCEKAFQWELSLKEHLKSHANRGHITDTMVGEIYLKQITQQKLKKKEDKKGKLKFIDPNTSQESPTVNCQRVSKPSVKCESFQEAAAYNPNTSLAEISETENQRPPLQKQQTPIHASGGNKNIAHCSSNGEKPYIGRHEIIKAENTADNSIYRVSKPLVKYETFQEPAAYNPNPIFLAIPKTENQRPPLQQQQTPFYENMEYYRKRSSNGNSEMIKAENTVENGFVCVSKPLVKYETLQEPAAYNPNTSFSASPKTENQRPPLQQQGWMIKVESTAENGIVCRINCIRNDEGTSTNAGFGNVFCNSAMRDKSKDNPFPTAVNNMGRPSNSRYN
ncbi:Zinc finger and BTB domain-containing protein 43, partial [Trichinella zimbabwensis]